MNAPVTIPPKGRESTEDRRTAIALAARDLIVEKGFEGLRTRDIAERVGINIATLHYHVPTKEALIGLVAELMQAEFAAQSDARPREGMTPPQLLALEFDDYAELLGEKKYLLTAASELMERARRDEAIRSCMFPLMGRWKQILAGILEAGRTSGDFRRDLDPRAAAQIFIGAMVGFSRGPDPTPENFEPLRAELWRAVRNPEHDSSKDISQ